MCGKTLVTKQSGDTGFPCNAVYIVEKVKIDKEFYLSITLDRKAGGPVVIYSPAGGMNIEDVAHKTPDQIFKIPIDILKGLEDNKIQDVGKNLGAKEH